MNEQAVRPFTILVAALGGEGGGMLADWLVDAAIHEGFTVQSTSIPGVSQRTGATVASIRDMGYAVGQLGGSADAAQASLEAMVTGSRRPFTTSLATMKSLVSLANTRRSNTPSSVWRRSIVELLGNSTI